MLTPNQLNRTSAAYRRGYREGIEGKPFEPQGDKGTFVFEDYRDGYLAGRDEMHWAAKLRANAIANDKANRWPPGERGTQPHFDALVKRREK
jgi:hypothetical protein